MYKEDKLVININVFNLEKFFQSNKEYFSYLDSTKIEKAEVIFERTGFFGLSFWLTKEEISKILEEYENKSLDERALLNNNELKKYLTLINQPIHFHYFI